MTLLRNPQTIIAYGKHQPPSEKARLLVETLQALTYLHRRDLLHRDIKPMNVLVTTEGQVKLLDFGLTTPVGRAESVSGTLAYMAPETLRSQTISPASDLYAVGILAYELFVGTHPFTIQNPSRLIYQILQATPDFSSLPDERLAAVLERWLMKDPADRYQTAEEIIFALCTAIDRTPPPESHAIRESFLLSSPFIGRECELAQLQTALQEAQAGMGAVWLVGGESGVGKSRLVEELRTLALVEGVLVMRGQAIESGDLPYQLWRNVLPMLALTGNIRAEQAGILKEILPDIDRLLGHPVSLAAPLTGQAYGMRLSLTILELLRQLGFPAVLILEDMQWAGQSRATLTRLAAFVHSLPLLVIATYRDDEYPALPHEIPGAKNIYLKRLEADEIARLSTAMLGSVGRQYPVVDFLKRETEGNIFFLIEVVRALAEEAGALRQIGQKTLPEHIFTGGIERIIRRRLAKVPTALQSLLRLAAVMGHEINEDLLAYAYDRVQVENLLIAASHAAVLAVQDNRWYFTHDKLREGLLRDMSATELAIYHWQAATAIEAVYPGNADYNEKLLEHWYQAGDSDRALTYLERVVERLIQFDAQYDRVHALLERGWADLSDDDPRRPALLNQKSDAYLRQSNYTLALETAQQAYTLAEQQHNRRALAYSGNHQGFAYEMLGQFDLAKTTHEKSLSIWRELGDKTGIAHTLNELGMVTYRLGNFAVALDYHQQSMTINEVLGNNQGLAHNLKGLAINMAQAGQYVPAVAYLERSVALCRELGDRFSLAKFLTTLGIMLKIESEYEQAAQCHQEALANQQVIGDQQGVAVSLRSLGTLAMAQWQLDQAEDYFKQSLAIEEQLDYPPGKQAVLVNLGWVAFHQGNYQQAQAYFDREYTIAQALNSSLTMVYSLRNRAFMDLKLNPARATTTLIQTLEWLQNTDSVPLRLELLIAGAQYYVQQQQPGRAGALLGLVQNHPAYRQENANLLRYPLAELTSILAPDDLQAALEAGHNQDISTAVSALLKDLRGTNDDPITGLQSLMGTGPG